MSTAIGQLILGVSFFGMRSSKYLTTHKGEAKRKRILQKSNIRFYIKLCKITYNSGRIHLLEEVSQTFSTQKKWVKNETVTQWQTGKCLYLVQIWSDINSRLELYPGTSYDIPVNTLWVENHKSKIIYQMTIKFMRSRTLNFG